MMKDKEKSKGLRLPTPYFRGLTRLIGAMLLVVFLTGCYHHDYAAGRHYSFNYNFVVKADSISLLRQQPEELASELFTDSFAVTHGMHLVVADIRTIPTDTIDSVWVQVATESSEFGWTHERELLQSVTPDDPISQFILTFSDIHVLASLILITLLLISYLLRKARKLNAHIVHFNDIDSIYPTLLTLLVATAATFYASLQMFTPELWQQFYYHPTLNPFSVPGLLAFFLITLWAMLIIAIAAVDDLRGQLPFGEALLYIGSLIGVCAVNYIVFSITTLWYFGYALLVAYYIFAIWKYRKHERNTWLCGNCGLRIYEKGSCPHCGTINK